MRGTSHVFMNCITAGFIGATGYLLTNTNCVSFLKEPVVQTSNFLLHDPSIPFVIHVGLSIFLYILGSLLPDIDHPYSAIGKIIHIPIAHRTWLHAIYIPVGLFIGGIWIRCLFWLGLGYFFHLFWDSFSASGINWFYPKKNKHHILKLYHTSELSEGIFVGIFLMLFVVYLIFVILQVVNREDAMIMV